MAQNINMLQADLDALETKLGATRELYRQAGGELQSLSKRRDALVEQILRAHADGASEIDLMKTDTDYRRHILDESWGHDYAADVLEKWVKSYGDFFYGTTRCHRSAGQVAPHMKLSERMDIEPVALAIEAIAPLIRISGHDDVLVDIFEYTLSETGSYHMLYDLTSGYADLMKTTYGAERSLLYAPLRTVLEKIARDHYYK